MTQYNKAQKDEALDALESVITLGRVEMYKPIQVAEVLYRLRTEKNFSALDLNSYKNPSIRWRNQVTDRIMGKHSTSSAQFQHHLWGDSAIPPRTLDILAQINEVDAKVEKRIYSAILLKQMELIEFRDKLPGLSNAVELSQLFEIFSKPTLSTSRDRLFEIIVASTFQALVHETQVFLSVHGLSSTGSEAMSALYGLVSAKQIPLKIARLGHTNAADSGIDVWTNFGVLVNIKHREVDKTLLEQIFKDTPKGELLVVCKSVHADVLESSTKENSRNVAFVTIEQLWGAVDDISKTPSTWSFFKGQLSLGFDSEFPMTTSLLEFLKERLYA